MKLPDLLLFGFLTTCFGWIALAKTEPAPLPTGSWNEHGFSKSQLQSIRSAYEKGIEEKFIPGGSLMLIHEGEVIVNEGFGYADLKSKKPFTANTPCRIASLTKPHTTTMIALLVEQSKLSFEDTVDKYIPDYKSIRVKGTDKKVAAPTIAQCLSHTAGFPSNNDLKAGKFNVHLDGNLESVIGDLATKPLFHEPGTYYAYSRLGFMTAGRVAEIVMKKSFPQIMEEELFNRIGAKDSTFDLDKMMPFLPTPYVRTRQGLTVRTGEGLGTAVNPGGSMIATPDGVARLFLLHRNRGIVDGQRIISEKVLKQMYVPQPGTRGSGYGFGFNILQKRADGTAKRIQHTGASGTIGIIDFDLDLIVIILTQVPQAQTNKWRGPLLKTIFAVFED